MSTLSGGPSIILDNLVLNLDSANIKSYPGSGATWTDLSRSGSIATLFNTPTFSNGVLNFDDASLEYATIPNIGNLTNWTIEAWFRLTAALGTKLSSLVANQFDGVNKLNYSVGSNNASAGNIAVGFFDGSWRSTTGFTPVISVWYQVVGSYDSSVIRQYVNGVASGGTLNYVGTPQSGGEIRLMRRWDSALTSANLIDGDLPIVRIYNRALTATEILQNYNTTKTRFGL